MKKAFVFRYNILILFSLTAFFLFTASCTDDNITTGDSNTDLAVKFLGTWHVSDNGAKLNYDVTIERSTDNFNTEIILNNFGGLHSSVTGSIIENSVVIEKQAAGDGYYVEGSGKYINASKLEFTYTLDDGIETEMRKAVFTK